LRIEFLHSTALIESAYAEPERAVKFYGGIRLARRLFVGVRLDQRELMRLGFWLLAAVVVAVVITWGG
jgi:hypothetical protein